MTVVIDDANDNRPRFAEPVVTLLISESSSAGSTYVVLAASDPDSPQFAVQRYELDSRTDKFGLEVTQNIDGTQEVVDSMITAPRHGCKVLRTACLYVCLFVCLSVRSHYIKSPHPNFTKFSVHMLLVAVARFSSAIRYVLPVLWVTSCFHIMDRMGKNQRRCVCFIQFTRCLHRGEVYRLLLHLVNYEYTAHQLQKRLRRLLQRVATAHKTLKSQQCCRFWKQYRTKFRYFTKSKQIEHVQFVPTLSKRRNFVQHCCPNRQHYCRKRQQCRSKIRLYRKNRSTCSIR